MIEIASGLFIDERDLEERFVRAAGPGGQNVNKLSSAVELRFDLWNCITLPPEVRWRASQIAGRKLIEASLPFVITVANEYRRWGVALEDLIQQGNLGLLKAAMRFNPHLSDLTARIKAKGRPPKVAITAVMRKLLVILNTVVRDGRPCMMHSAARPAA